MLNWGLAMFGRINSMAGPRGNWPSQVGGYTPLHRLHTAGQKGRWSSAFHFRMCIDFDDMVILPGLKFVLTSVRKLWHISSLSITPPYDLDIDLLTWHLFHYLRLFETWATSGQCYAF